MFLHFFDLFFIILQQRTIAKSMRTERFINYPKKEQVQEQNTKLVQIRFLNFCIRHDFFLNYRGGQILVGAENNSEVTTKNYIRHYTE